MVMDIEITYEYRETNDFSILFEKLEEAKSIETAAQPSLRDDELNESIRRIKQIVESYSKTPEVFTFTRS